MPISDEPKIYNTELVSFVETSKSWAKERMKKFMEKKVDEDTSFPLVLLICIVVGAATLFYYLYKWLRVLETPENITRIARDSITAQNQYGKDNPSRVGIQEYLIKLKQEGVPDKQLVLTNFYVSTVNASGLFSPVVDGIASPEAIRLAALAGARGFIFDIWPDLSPGANFGPVIQTVESGSLWRRVTMNSLPFSYVLKTLAEEAFEINSRPGYYDPLFIYLRFRGNPRRSTFDLTAKALSANFEQYRLSNIYNRCRHQDEIFSTPITDLLRKVVICCNVSAEGTNLRDYINVGPKAGVKPVYGVNDARGMTQEAIVQGKRVIQQNLTWVAPLSEEVPAESNNWDPQISLDLGIMFCAMNFWDRNDTLKKYMAPDMFGKQSFKIKPEPLRYILEILPKPLSPPYPGWNGAPDSGTPTPPKEIKLP